MGTLKRPRRPPIKHIGAPVWYVNIYTASGRKIKKFMSEKEAQAYSLRTGKMIYMYLRDDIK